MIDWMRRRLRQWAFQTEAGKLSGGVATVESDSMATGDVRITVKHAINGKVLDISTYKPNPRGSDWTHELFVVPEGENLKDALTMLLLLKGLDK